MKVQPEKDAPSKSDHESTGFDGPQAKSGTATLTPPPFNLESSSGGGGGTIQAKGFMDGLGDFFGTRDNEAALDLQEDIDDFKSEEYGPITYTQDKIAGSAFEATYFPAQEKLLAQVRAKARFADCLVVDGGKVSSSNSFMNKGALLKVLNTYPDLLALVLPYFQWTAEQKEVTMIRFLDNMKKTESMWEDTGLSMHVADPGWEGVIARPDIDIQMSEGEAVTKMEDYGPFGWLSRVDERGSDHLQVEIVKQVNPADAATVNGIVAAYIAALPAPAAGAPANPAVPPAGDVRGVRSYASPDKKRNTNPEGFNNFMSIRSNGCDSPEQQTYEHKVFFENGSADLSILEWLKLEVFLSNPMTLIQNESGVDVSLNGYSSAAGSTKSNSAMVAKRLATVSEAINKKMDSKAVNIKTHVDPAAQTNDADASAEADKKVNPAHDPAAFRRVDIKIVQKGRAGQNTFAHEMGHVFGLGDEYAEVGGGYNRPVGSAADHDQLAKDAGVPTGAVVADDARVMSTGKDFQAAHYSTFADALKRLTKKSWNIV